MPRRRPTFGTYARRRWRAMGAVVVLLMGALLVLAITDRGHDPLWQAQTGEIDQLDVAPDASVVYVLVRERGNLSALQARSGEDGHLLWESPILAPRARLRAASDGVVVATDFPTPFLTRFGADGSVRFQVAFEGNPHALDVDGPHVALALQAPDFRVIVMEGDQVVRNVTSPSLVQALDVERGRLVTGSAGGEVRLFGVDGSLLYNTSLPIEVRTLRLSEDGGFFAVGGAALTPGGKQGLVASFDITSPTPERWRTPTDNAIGLIEMDRAGVVVVAVEDRPPAASAHVYAGATGLPLWGREVDGNVFRDDAGAFGSLAVAPDGTAVAFASLGGRLEVADAADGETLWTFGTRGAPILEFADGAPDAFVAGGRLTASRLYETAFLFSLREEPPLADAGTIAALSVVAAVLLAATLLGVGFWRARRAV